MTYVENGQSESVPSSDVDGWVLDEALGCIVLVGTWEDQALPIDPKILIYGTVGSK